MKKIIKSLVAFLLLSLFLIPTIIYAKVSVKGYYRKDGTYVAPYTRSNPDGNPYNNYGYPGNYNPNTGSITTGDPNSYMNSYCKESPNNAYCSGYGSTYAPTVLPTPTPISSYSYTNNLSSLPDNTLIKRVGSEKIFKVSGGKKYWIPTAERFSAMGYNWNNVKTVSNNFTDDTADGTVIYKEGLLVKSPNLPFIWLVGDKSRKWIFSYDDFIKCGFEKNITYTIPETEIQGLSWFGNIDSGKIVYPNCK